MRNHYEFIQETADKFRARGATVHIVSGLTYYEFVKKRSTRGKFKGRAFGFPPFITGTCNFKRDSKEKALKSIDVGRYDYEDIGIAFDEVNRQGQLNSKKRSILCELEYTEQMALKRCSERGLLSPHYFSFKRDGCTLCPNASPIERYLWFRDYPEAFDIVLELQEFVKRERPEQSPLRDYKWFIEDGIKSFADIRFEEQLTFF